MLTRRTLLKTSAVGLVGLIEPLVPVEARGSVRKTDDLDLLEDWPKLVVEQLRLRIRPGTQMVYLADRTHAKQYKHFDKNDCESFYTVDQIYVGFAPTAEFMEDIRKGHGVDYFVMPAAQSFARSINMFAPNCDRVITHGLDPHRISGTILSSFNDGGIGITLTLEEGVDNHKSLVSLNMMTGFYWKRHYD